ncbi:MAG: acetylxylan esterase [Paenibacillaceae bacterium]|nr:acetylxylan esterase [Paenibacillaceae bacterium]
MIQFDTKAYLRNMSQRTERVYDRRNVAAFGGFEQWQRSFRQRLSELLGLDKLGWMSAIDWPAPRLLERTEEPDHIREKWHIAVEPEVTLPLYLLLPKAGKPPYPLVIAPHGHECGKEAYAGLFENEEERQRAVAIDQTIGLQAVGQGYAVIAPNVRGFREMARIEELSDAYSYPISNPYTRRNSCEELQRRSLFYGRTLTGDRVHDMRRVIDFASTRSEIDMRNIIMTGNSTGGTVSLFTAAVDERVGIVVPSCSFCNFTDTALQIYHCSCGTIPGMLQWGEYEDIAGLIAPRPLLIINGAKDDLFPSEDASRAFAGVREIYREAGAPDRCEHFIGPEGHRFYKEAAWRFIRRHLPV